MRRKFNKNTALRLRADAVELWRKRPEPWRSRRRQEKVYLRTKNSRLRAFFFVVFCVLMASCYDKGDCILTSSNLVRMDFFDSKATATAKTILFDSALVLPANYMFKDTASVSVSSILLPVDPAVNQTAFIIYYDKKVDTLVMSYTTQAQVLSPDCGTFSYQNDLKIEYSTFPADSAVVINQKLRINFLAPKDPVVNVKIYH